MLQLKIGVQIAGLRLPLKNALPVVARMGAAGVELDARGQWAKGLGRTAVRHLKKILSDYQLKIASLTFQIRHPVAELEYLEQRVEGIKQAMKLAYQLGTNTIVCDIGGLPDAQSNVEDYSRLRDVLTDIGNFGQKEGVFLAARTMSPSPQDLHQLIQDLPTGSLMIDFDPGGLILNDHDVQEALDLLGTHVVHLHARDGVRDLSVRQGVEVQLGRGSVDWPLVFAKLEKSNYAGYATLQRDASSDPVTEYHESCQYLKEIFV